MIWVFIMQKIFLKNIKQYLTNKYSSDIIKKHDRGRGHASRFRSLKTIYDEEET